MKIGEALSRFRGQREFHIDLIGRRRGWFLLSGAIVTISIIALFAPGLNLGIDFRGGALLEFENRANADSEGIRERLAGLGRQEAVVQEIGDGEVSVRLDSLGDDRSEILGAVADEAGILPDDINVDDVGPKWGEQISAKALQGLLIFLAVVTVYITLRFEWKMSIGAIVALLHDLVITFGVYALVGREVTPEAVIAILTILGYSLYDSVVIFDKVKENTEQLALVARESYGGAVNLSLNQVLMRSVNTSLTSLLPIGALLLLGGETLKNFAFALFVGVAVGTYSSIFVAAPVLVVLKEREPRLRQARERVERRESVRLAAVPAGDGEEISEPGSRGPSKEAYVPPSQIAPRKPRRKKQTRRQRKRRRR